MHAHSRLYLITMLNDEEVGWLVSHALQLITCFSQSSKGKRTFMAGAFQN